MKYHFTPTRMCVIKITDADEDVEKLETSCSACENTKLCSHCDDSSEKLHI